MSWFIEVSDEEGQCKVTLNVDWIKAVIPKPKVHGEGTYIIVGDGYYNSANSDDRQERYVVSESYEVIQNMIKARSVIFYKEPVDADNSK